MSEVNGGDIVFVRCGFVCLSVCAQRTCQSDQFKTVKATDFKFDMRVSRTVRAWPLENFAKGGICKNSLGGDMHSRARLLVQTLVLYKSFTYLVTYLLANREMHTEEYGGKVSRETF